MSEGSDVSAVDIAAEAELLLDMELEVELLLDAELGYWTWSRR